MPDTSSAPTPNGKKLRLAPGRKSTPSPTAVPRRLPGGLVYVSPSLPGLTRVRSGVKGFRYRTPDGAWLSDPAEISRIQSLAIPPAYTTVWICPLPNGHLQATGIDARGRTQYRYHPDWRAQRDEGKFEHMQAFGRALPRIRARIARELRSPARGRSQTLTRTRVLATLVRLLDTTYLRVGNEEYATTNRSYGLTTLRNRHADLRGNRVTLRFRGKSGVLQEAVLDDPRVARVVRHCQDLPGQELFQYVDDDGSPRSLGSTDVNDYLREITGPDAAEHFTAKDFRTWHGTTLALELTRLSCMASQPDSQTLSADGERQHAQGSAAAGQREDSENETGEKNTGNVTGANRPATASTQKSSDVTRLKSSSLPRYSAVAVLKEVASHLGNTPAVCKKSYVHPAVLSLGAHLVAGTDPSLQQVWDRIGGAASPRGLSAAERRLLVFLRKWREPGTRKKS